MFVFIVLLYLNKVFSVLFLFKPILRLYYQANQKLKRRLVLSLINMNIEIFKVIKITGPVLWRYFVLKAKGDNLYVACYYNDCMRSHYQVPYLSPVPYNFLYSSSQNTESPITGKLTTLYGLYHVITWQTLVTNVSTSVNPEV